MPGTDTLILEVNPMFDAGRPYKMAPSSQPTSNLNKGEGITELLEAIETHNYLNEKVLRKGAGKDQE